MNYKYKIGDKVIPIKPVNELIRYPGRWHSSMDSLVGTVQVISEREPNRGNVGVVYYLKGCAFHCYWRENWLMLAEDFNSNQYRKTCKWCKDIKLKQKRVESVNFTFNYCPECGR